MNEELIEQLAEKLHNHYEVTARQVGWSTQKKTRVPFRLLPEANKAVMREMARFVRRLFLCSCEDVSGQDVACPIHGQVSIRSNQKDEAQNT